MCTKKCAHEHTGPAESIRPSLRDGLTVRAGGMAVFLEARPCDRGPKHSLICPAGQVGSNPPYALMIVRLFLNSGNLAGGDRPQQESGRRTIGGRRRGTEEVENSFRKGAHSRSD